MTLPDQNQPPEDAPPTGHMLVCGDDGLADRLAAELAGVYGQRVELVRGLPDDRALAGAGVRRAAALALVYELDQTNIDAALRARRLNPRLRLVLRLYNSTLGRHLTQLLDQDPDASTTVLSDADTAAPALVAAAVTGTKKTVQVDGRLLGTAEHRPTADGEPSARAVCTLAVQRLDGTSELLPDDGSAMQPGCPTVSLESVAPAERVRARRRLGAMAFPLRALFSSRLRWSITALVASLGVLAFVGWFTGQRSPLQAGYMTLLDIFSINDPATKETTSRKLLQLLSGLTGLLLLPVLTAAAIEALGTFRNASALRRPPRGLSGHVVLLGLGKIGSRVLTGLHELGIPVVCVEADADARGVPLARQLHVPTVLGDVTEGEVLRAAKTYRAAAILAVTSDYSTNLMAVLGARALNPELRAVLRLHDDQVAAAVYRTLRDAHPQAQTRSRSVSALAAPAFAGAMMGRQILGSVSVDRQIVVLAALEVAGQPQLEGHTVEQAFRAGARRVLALDIGGAEGRSRDLSAPGEPQLLWDVHPGYVLQAGDRAVLACTREGLGELLGRRERSEV